VSKRGEAPLVQYLPPPLPREGDKAGPRENQRFFWVLKGGGLPKNPKNFKGKNNGLIVPYCFKRSPPKPFKRIFMPLDFDYRASY